MCKTAGTSSELAVGAECDTDGNPKGDGVVASKYFGRKDSDDSGFTKRICNTIDQDDDAEFVTRDDLKQQIKRFMYKPLDQISIAPGATEDMTSSMEIDASTSTSTANQASNSKDTMQMPLSPQKRKASSSKELGNGDALPTDSVDTDPISLQEFRKPKRRVLPKMFVCLLLLWNILTDVLPVIMHRRMPSRERYFRKGPITPSSF